MRICYAGQVIEIENTGRIEKESMSNIKINIFEAGYGDSFLIEFDNSVTLLIDGGTKESMQYNIDKIRQSYDNHQHNYVLLTHIDNDHINGILSIFEQCKNLCEKVSRVIFNKTSDLKTFMPNSEDLPPSIYIKDENMRLNGYSEGKKLEDKLAELNIPVCSNIVSGTSYTIKDINIQVLAPSIKNFENYKRWEESQEYAYIGSKISDYNKGIDELIHYSFVEDTGVINLSSISILLEYKEKKLLFLGDSAPSIIAESLNKLGYSSENKLCLDIVKVSHHGSKHNTSTELLEIIQCNKFIISTDGKRFGHPDKECLARIISSQDSPELIFNYKLAEKIFSFDELNSKLFLVSVKNEVNL